MGLGLDWKASHCKDSFLAEFLWVVALARWVTVSSSVYFAPFNKAPIQHVSSHQSVPTFYPKAAGIPSWSLAEGHLNGFSVDRYSACSDIQSICTTMIQITNASINYIMKHNSFLFKLGPHLLSTIMYYKNTYVYLVCITEGELYNRVL